MEIMKTFDNKNHGFKRVHYVYIKKILRKEKIKKIFNV
jgi:hypothetical protein